MYRIILSADDLARIRVAGTVGASIEAIFAMATVRKNSAEYFRAWRQQIRQLTDQERSPLRRLKPSLLRTSQILGIWTNGGTLASLGQHIPAPLRAEVTDAVRDFCRIAVEPHWHSIRSQLEEDQDALRNMMSSHGIEALLNSLGPRIRWNAPVLEIDSEESGELCPSGGGLLLSPSLFLQDPAELLLKSGSATSGPTLILPSHPDLRFVRPLQLGSGTALAAPPAEEPLVALVGRTRAAALHALHESCSSGELADRLGISAAAVSQHTTILRGAGLIATRRARNRAEHTLTSLGRHLLRGEGEHAVPTPRLERDAVRLAAQ
ncbi:winged helix-turn-helix domain-containing protein [Streptomyces celluloflavus]|uniref:winged helix-turn-helix domain-containing protein n=1 Tax=Streptomyces celluloflavus TaxID=58344 RepID=UPI0036535970